MATLSVTIPNAMVPTLVTVATTWLNSIGIDTSGMTGTQIGQRYIAEKLKQDYIAQKTSEQVATSANEVTAAIAQAKTDAAGIG